MRTAAICPTCATFENALCVLYNGEYLPTLDISPMDSLEEALEKIEVAVSGVTGTSGSSGSSGSSGTSGLNGTSGINGTSGFDGTSGSSGISGTSGSTGTSGTSGTTGTSGLSGDRYLTNSSTSITIVNTGTVTLTVDPDLSYTPLQSIIITYDINNYMQGTVISYDTITGVLQFTVQTALGVGNTYSSWIVNLFGAAGGDGTSGTSGTSGISGTSGGNGSSGTSGAAGTSGTSGINGSPGAVGTSGTSGINGTSGTSGVGNISGTLNYIPKFTSSNSLGNSIISESGSIILLNGAAATLRIGSNSGDHTLLTYSGGATILNNNWASTSGYVRIAAYNKSWDFYGDGNLYTPGYVSSNLGFYSVSLGTYMIPISTGWQVQSGSASLSRWEFKTSDGVTRGFMGCNNTGVVGGVMNTLGNYVWYTDANGYTTAGSGGFFNGIVTATSFSGAGTGLTGTASSLNIGGNAGSATLWGGKEFSYSTTGSINSYMLTYGGDGKVHVEDVNTIRSFLGLGSNAYTSTAFLPLAGGTLTGALGGTSASFSSSVTSTGFFESSSILLKDIISRDGDVAYFKWKNKQDDKIHIGYIAEEKQTTNPDQVNTEGEYLAVNYVEILVQKVRELEKEIELLKEKTK